VRVFVAGATGAIGRPLVPMLIEAGHEVTGMTRSDERADRLREAGAEAVVADALDAEAVRRAVAGASPEAVVHQLTDLPQELSTRPDYSGTSRLRTDGTRHLLDGARAAGATRFIAQSIAFIYAPQGGTVKDEDAPTLAGGDSAFAKAIDATLELERAVTTAEGLEGLALRYGFFYGPGTYYAPGTRMARQVQRRWFPIVGDGAGVFSFIHVDDAAAATVAALTHGAPGVYNVVDDDPAPMREWLPAFAEALGAKPPRRVPLWLGKLVARDTVAMAAAMRGASNAKAKRELGWAPRYPSWREGFRAVLG
jgi:nucleoside-diphosphate-sugar epimerase